MSAAIQNYRKYAADFPQVERYPGFTQSPVYRVQNQVPEPRATRNEMHGLRTEPGVRTDTVGETRFVTGTHNIYGVDRSATLEARTALDETWEAMLTTFGGMITDENELIHRKSRSVSGSNLRTAFSGGNLFGSVADPVAFSGGSRSVGGVGGAGGIGGTNGAGRSSSTVNDALTMMDAAQAQQSRMYTLLNRSAIIQGVMKSFQKVVDNLSRGS